MLVPADLFAFAIAMFADAWARPQLVWEGAGRDDRRWWLVALGVSIVPLGWATSIVYFRRVRPQLVASASEVGE